MYRRSDTQSILACQQQHYRIHSNTRRLVFFLLRSDTLLKWGHVTFMDMMDINVSIIVSLMTILSISLSFPSCFSPQAGTGIINLNKTKLLATRKIMFAVCILARARDKTAVLNQLGKQGYFSAGSGSIIAILWHTATGEASQIHLKFVNIKLGKWPLCASHCHLTQCFYFCVIRWGRCIYLCSHDLSLAQKRGFTDIFNFTCLVFMYWWLWTWFTSLL